MWLACGRGLDVTCRAGCVGKNVFQSYREAALFPHKVWLQPTGLRIPAGRESQAFLSSDRFVGVLKSWARCKVHGAGILGRIPVLRLQGQHLLPHLVW